jgi:hypothetical protein
MYYKFRMRILFRISLVFLQSLRINPIGMSGKNKLRADLAEYPSAG